MIIRTSSNELYEVRPTNDANLDHVWYGQRVKLHGMKFVHVKKIRTELVRKAATVLVQA